MLWCWSLRAEGPREEWPERSTWDDSVAAFEVLAHRLPGATPKKEHFFLGQHQLVVPPPE